MMQKNNIKHLLISRTDNIGDVILTLPLVGILKQQFPEMKISFLGREYVRAIIEHCADIDSFFSYDALTHLSKEDAIAQIKAHAFDAVIHAFPNKPIALLMKQAGVHNRIGTSHRLYHWWTCNARVNFSRAKSDEHEAQLNLKLLKPFHIETTDNLERLGEYLGLQCKDQLPPHLKSLLKTDRFNLIVHPFTNGHAREWPVSHFNALIRQLPKERVHVIVTGSQKESVVIQDRMLSQCPDITNVAGQCSLRELVQLIANSDGLVANSTGPLHIAAALGIHALGLFPITKGMDPKRWGPIGKKAEVLTANPECQSPRCRHKQDCLCMESITVDQVKAVILNWAKNADAVCV
ncbi:MAG: hypothetical protein A3F13_02960 [Gammaproteobacteria bacterium RIFCSPHIGHO2_12_FULL_40_19]|nr:MAG: hypothetical protein A3F13_02960 [Gammaproteobacteria bacterium RIFCSPHIGHO2_12_FULL_40_19]